MAKISFDYDGVLTTSKGQNLIMEMMRNGNEVFIITARRISVDVLELARKLNIPMDHVFFTSGSDKWKTIQKLNIDQHYDNNQEQIDKINLNTKSKGSLFKS
jgi:uncharacterized HAD superfamily protein